MATIRDEKLHLDSSIDIFKLQNECQDYIINRNHHRIMQGLPIGTVPPFSLGSCWVIKVLIEALRSRLHLEMENHDMCL